MPEGAESHGSWHLATWVDKTETEDGIHLIRSVRQLDTDEYVTARNAISELHQFTLREAFVFVIDNQLEYQNYETSIWSSLESEPLHALQRMAPEYGGGLRNRFLNWLLSVKAFLDLTETQLKRRYGEESEEFSRFKQATKKEYDSNFSYRFVYRLRNFAQHSAFPPLEGRIKGEVEEETGETYRWLELYLDKDKLLDQWTGWGPLRRELEAFPTEIPVDDHIEAAMASLTQVAAVVREIDFPALKGAAEIVNALCNEASRQSGTPILAKMDPENPEEILSWHWLFRVKVGEAATAGEQAEEDD
jgi:hypothetical protein